MKQKSVDHLKWGVILTYATTLLNIILSILYTPIMLRVLGQSEHGLYSTVSSAMSWLSLLSLGIGSSYIRFFAKYSVNNDHDAIASLNGIFIIIFSIIGAVCLFCGFVIANNLRIVFADGMTSAQYETARILALIVTVNMAISFPASVFNSYIRAKEKYIQVKVASLFQNICTPLLTLPLLLSGHGSIGMVAATTVVNFIAYSYNVIYCFRKINIRIKFRNFEPGIMKGIFGYSVFIALNSLISQFATGLDKIVITRYINTSAASVYAIGGSLYSYYYSFSEAVSGVFTTRIHKITAEFNENKGELKKRLTEQFVMLGRIQFLIQMLMLTGIIFFGKVFIHLWAERGGQDYGNSYYVALLLCVSSTVPLIQNIGTEVQRAQNKHRYRTAFYAGMTAINVVLTIILCKRWGEVGAAVGTAIASVAVDVIVMNIFYHKRLYIDILEFWGNILRMSLGLIAPVAFGFFAVNQVKADSILSFLAWVAIYTAVYVLSMWLISMNDTEKEFCTGWIKKRKNAEKGTHSL